MRSLLNRHSFGALEPRPRVWPGAEPIFNGLEMTLGVSWRKAGGDGYEAAGDVMASLGDSLDCLNGRGLLKDDIHEPVRQCETCG
jgi:hypothetical protein